MCKNVVTPSTTTTNLPSKQRIRNGATINDQREGRKPFLSSLISWTLRLVVRMAITIIFLLAFYLLTSTLHVHSFVSDVPHAGPATVYIPGGGFSGFWFHLGYLHSIPQEDLLSYDYYCFSAGCLSILSVFMNKSLDEVSEAAFAAQNAWTSGNRSRFELVDHFFDTLVPSEPDHGNELTRNIIPRIKVLVTTLSGRVEIVQANNVQELKDGIIKTTWVPYLTGWGFPRDTTSGATFVDGGFSRFWHPRCETRLDLPLIWDTLVHTFNPALDYTQVRRLWRAGYEYRHYKMPRKVDRTFVPTNPNNFTDNNND
ncbi:hypothetical protein IV203_010978 [Nitzschia inconspicua]|uniref:Uncharacterized protein n=1 Tax=Nitzschia inconspicua TaxID=303405 RepID=A0A9K3KYQ5_9STRA|nr:hypothetical protein IV203_010978 [Nitzschia inconspicua]